LLGNGNGTFQPAQNYDGAYSPDLRNESGITSGDVDNDGDIDIMVGNAASNDVSIYLNKGDGHFIFKLRTGMYWGVASPIYADFTGDGKNDIIAVTSIPPSGIQSQLALIKGNILNTGFVTNDRTKKDNITKNITQADDRLIVINNPFINYIDIKFEQILSGKITFLLTDVTGRLIAMQEINTNNQSIIRFNVGNKVIKSGTYILTGETGGNKYSAKVMKQ